MQKLIKNNWRRKKDNAFEKTNILSHDIHPEGLDVERVRFVVSGSLTPKPHVGHVISILRGTGSLHVESVDKHSFQLAEGVHLYLPPFTKSIIEADEGAELLCVSSASASQARGKQMLLRDEAFISACATGNHAFRWVLTPQYLSRRIFLHHDQVLTSKSGNPVSWFRTTMFDVTGLPCNDMGEPVFKMSYNSRTEFNVCYDVQGMARVRMARHPYGHADQDWEPWSEIDGNTTYHLNEAAGGPEEECLIEEGTGNRQFLRNKHEVQIVDGYVTLFCLFDPAPTGIERHRPGEDSDYEPLSRVLGTAVYEAHRREIIRYDEMVDNLSMAKAQGRLDLFKVTPLWEMYVRGREALGDIEAGVAKTLAAEGNGRASILERWMHRIHVS
jgi:hypothetical protein